jgi:sugar (glycoside-pentoside-hexuronide) transporter
MPQRLSITEKLAYGLGDAAANLVFQTQLTFLMFFYTDVLGIAAGAAGTILLVSRAADAFNDPIIGALADRGDSRWGRYRPWVLWTAVPMAVALVLCYTTPPFSSQGKVVWAVATYNILMVIYAANNIPYSALAGVMTGDSHERTSLLSWRFVCAMGAALVVNVLTFDMIEILGGGDPASGYQLTMAVWGVLAVILFGITFAFTRERIRPLLSQRSSLRQDVSDLFRNGPWFALFGLAVLISAQLSLRSGTMPYYFDHYHQSARVLSRISNFGVFSGIGLAFAILGVMLSKPLTVCLGKRATFGACLLLSSALMGAIVLVPPDSFAVLVALQIVLQLAFGPTIPILWAMMADVADYSEWKTGRRSTALAFASIIFGMKLGSGVGGWLNGELLDYFGYSAGADPSPVATRGIVMMISVIPAAVLLIGAAVLCSYHLDDRMVRQVEQSLNARRNDLDSASGE